MTGGGAWPAWANLAAVAGVTLVALSQLHPSLLLANTTTAGGDTGAHVIMPAFMKSHLLAHGQLTGWDPGWYDGFPLYTFYFPLPGLITVMFNGVVYYNVAFKLVTVLGTLTLPVCAWAFGRSGRAPGSGPGLPGRGHPALPLRAQLHHLRREHPVHPGRRVLLLAQPVGRPARSSASWPPACAPGGTGRWPPSCSPSPSSAT